MLIIEDEQAIKRKGVEEKAIRNKDCRGKTDQAFVMGKLKNIQLAK